MAVVGGCGIPPSHRDPHRPHVIRCPRLRLSIRQPRRLPHQDPVNNYDNIQRATLDPTAQDPHEETRKVPGPWAAWVARVQLAPDASARELEGECNTVFGRRGETPAA